MLWACRPAAPVHLFGLQSQCVPQSRQLECGSTTTPTFPFTDKEPEVLPWDWVGSNKGLLALGYNRLTSGLLGPVQMKSGQIPARSQLALLSYTFKLVCELYACCKSPSPSSATLELTSSCCCYSASCLLASGAMETGQVDL